MYRRILIPVDGSPTSDEALDHGLRQAKEQGAEVKIIHVLDTAALYRLYEGVVRTASVPALLIRKR